MKKHKKEQIKRSMDREYEIMDCKNQASVTRALIPNFKFLGILFSPCRLMKLKLKKEKGWQYYLMMSFLFMVFWLIWTSLPDNGGFGPSVARFVFSLVPSLAVWGLIRFLTPRGVMNVWWLAVFAISIFLIFATAGVFILVLIYIYVNRKGKENEDIVTRENIVEKKELLKKMSAENLIDNASKIMTIEEMEEEENIFLQMTSAESREGKISGYDWTRPADLVHFSEDNNKTIYIDNYAYYDDTLKRITDEDIALGGVIGGMIIEQAKDVVNNVKGKFAPIDFTKTIMAIGGMNSGKTEFFNSILNQSWYQRAIINDAKGDYTQKFYRPKKDIILNLYDERSYYWDIFSEMERDPQFVLPFVSNLLVSCVGEKPDFCLKAAKKIMVDSFMKIGFSDVPTEDKYQSLIMELEKYKEEPAEDKIKSSIVATIDLSIEIFKLIAYRVSQPNTKSFTLDSFLGNKDGQRLFLLNNQGYSEKLTPYFSGFIGAMISKILVNADTDTDLSFFLLDEFHGLHFDDETYSKLFMDVRSKGACVMTGIQYIDKNKDSSQMMDSNSYAMLVFNVSDEVTVNRIVSMFGDVEYEEKTTSTSFGHAHVGLTGPSVRTTNVNVNKNIKFAKLITPKLLQLMPKNTHLTIIPSEEILYLGYTKPIDLSSSNSHFESIDMQKLYRSLFSDNEEKR